MITQISSQHLANNLWGDPTTRNLVVYLPPGYEESRKRYPVVYLLHGFSGSALTWVPAFQMNIRWRNIYELADQTIKSGQSRELIIVMPDGSSRLGCSQWIDSPVNGNFEQYVTREIVPYVDANFRTIPDVGARGVTGISSGGFGAWHLASLYPDIFSATVLLSADTYFDFTHKPWIYRYFNDLRGEEPTGPINGNMWSWLTYGLAVCYSPNPSKPPFYVDLPVSYPSGELIPELWQKWLDYDPIVSWEPRQANLRRLRGILLDVGTRDEYYLHYGHRILSAHLGRAGIAHEVNEHPGTHTSLLYERIQVAMEWFSRILVSE